MATKKKAVKKAAKKKPHPKAWGSKGAKKASASVKKGGGKVQVLEHAYKVADKVYHEVGEALMKAHKRGRK